MCHPVYGAGHFGQQHGRGGIPVQGRLQLGLEHRHGGAQLVGCVRHKAPLLGHELLLACQQLVHLVDHRLQLFRPPAGQGRAIGRAAPVQFAAQRPQGPQRPVHHQPGDTGDHQHQQQLPGQQLAQQVGGLGLPGLQRLGHQDGGHTTALRHLDGLQQRHGLHRLTTDRGGVMGLQR